MENVRELLIPSSDRERYERNTKIYYDYLEMTKRGLGTENRKQTLLAAKHGVSVTMVRGILERYLAEFPVSEDKEEN